MNDSRVSARRISARRELEHSRTTPDTGPVVPSLLFVAGAENEAVDPVKRVMLAILNHAVCRYQAGVHGQDTAHLQAFLQAEEWLFGAGESSVTVRRLEPQMLDEEDRRTMMPDLSNDSTPARQ